MLGRFSRQKFSTLHTSLAQPLAYYSDDPRVPIRLAFCRPIRNCGKRLSTENSVDGIPVIPRLMTVDRLYTDVDCVGQQPFIRKTEGNKYYPCGLSSDQLDLGSPADISYLNSWFQ